MNSTDNVALRLVLIPLLVVGAAFGCQALLEPSPTAPPRVDGAVVVPVGDTGGTVTVTGVQEERPSTVADDVVDTVSTVAGAVTGNPLLWGLVAQLAHLGIGLVAGRKKAAA